MSPSMIRILEDLSALSGAIGQEGVDVLRHVVGAVYAELHDQVKRDDFKELKKVVAGMAEAQDRLAASHAAADARLTRIEAVLDRLAEAQAKTERTLDRLATDQVASDTRLARVEQVLGRVEDSRDTLFEEVGGIARNSAFFLEDRAYLGLA